MTALTLESAPAPFLKWAGGKRRVVPHILQRFPSSFERYFEPFLGAGAVFFALPSGIPKVVNDYNSELINAYEAIRDDVESVLGELRKRENSKEHYLEVRAWDRSHAFQRRTKASRAARFIYLNKCGFNGLYRVNSRGEYNVPYGHSENVDFVQETNLRAVSDFLNAKRGRSALVKLQNLDYRASLKSTRPGDFVYLDPPYDPVSETSSFVSYNSAGFGREDQKELRDQLLALHVQGVKFLLSNSDTAYIRELYNRPEVFNIGAVQVRRAISANAASRGPIGELLISNY